MGATRPYFNTALTGTVVDVSVRCQGILRGIQAYSINGIDTWLQVFDVAAASVTLGTTTPIQSYLIPKGNGTDRGAFTELFPDGISLGGVALSIAATTTETGNTAPTTAIEVNIQYV